MKTETQTKVSEWLKSEKPEEVKMGMAHIYLLCHIGFMLGINTLSEIRKTFTDFGWIFVRTEPTPAEVATSIEPIEPGELERDFRNHSLVWDMGDGLLFAKILEGQAKKKFSYNLIGRDTLRADPCCRKYTHLGEKEPAVETNMSKVDFAVLRILCGYV